MTVVHPSSISGISSLTTAASSEVLSFHINNTSERLRITAGGMNVTGVVTATSFVGAFTGTSSGNPTLTNGSNDRVITATGANALLGEANLTFNGAVLTVNGTSTDTPLILTTTSNNGSHMRFQKDGSNQHFIGAGGGFSLGDKEDLAFRTVDNLIFGVGTSEKVRIDSSGRVLIGTTTEGAGTYAETLTIAGTTHCGMTIRSATNGVGSIYFSDGTSGNSEYRGYFEYNHTNDFFKIATAATEGLRIDSSGRVLIGTSTAAGNGIHVLYSTVNSAVEFQNNTTGTGSGQGLYVGNSTSNIGYVWNYANDALVFATNNTEKMRLDAAGNVSLGKASASSTAYGKQLQIHDTGTTGAALHLTDANTGTGNGDGIHLVQQGAHFYHWLRENGNMVFATNGTERLKITSGGDIGVNCTPTALSNHRGITIQGAGSSAAGFINFRDTASNSDGRILASDGQLYIHADPSDNTADSIITFRVDDDEKARLTDKGNFTVNRYTCAASNTAGDFTVTVSGLTNNNSSNWRKCGVMVLYNGINPNATSSYSVAGYYGVGSVTNWNWLGNSENLGGGGFAGVTIDNATSTSFRLNFDVSDSNTGSVTVFVNAWNVRPIVEIAA